MIPDKIKKNIFISLAVAAALYLSFSIYADFENVSEAFAKFNWLWFPVILFLSFLNYTARFFKWDYYLRILNIKISTLDSFLIFMSGLIMSVTPGKMGELLKSYLVKQISNEPVSRTMPIILVERITDFLSLVLLALIGAYIFDYGRILVIGTGIFFILVTVLISQKNISLRLIEFTGRIKFISKFTEKIETAYQSAYILLKPAPLFYMTLVSLISWFFECFAYFLVLKVFNANINILLATFIYTFSTIAGAITMLPGGLGVTEGSLTFLLMRFGVSAEVSVSSTLIIRAATLWFAVFVGIVSVYFYQKKYGKDSLQSVNNL